MESLEKCMYTKWIAILLKKIHLVDLRVFHAQGEVLVVAISTVSQKSVSLKSH